ncbi:hypothetical protein AGMMS49579_26090 [Spirochaetia bacterium]|nr:hypothetical protein AGMMS49579_26090 [Spirochaetia bacterium]
MKYYKCFFIVIYFISINFLYAHGTIEKTYEFNGEQQFQINISKETILERLNKIMHVSEENDSIIIPFRMFVLKENQEGYNFPYVKLDVFESIDYGHITFYFYVLYDETIGKLILNKCKFIMDDRFGKVPEPDEIIDCFYQNVIKYITNDDILFYNTDKIANKNMIFNIEQVKWITLQKYEPKFESYWEYGFVRFRRSYVLENESISKLSQFDWVIKNIDFPNDYFWYRYPDMVLEFMYQLKDDEFVKYGEDNRLIDHGNRYYNVNIWKNNEQYFCQMNNDAKFYTIDIEKLRKIIDKTII